LDPVWAGGVVGDVSGGVVDGLVAALLQQREDARARKDFASADAIRERLRASGVDVEDTPRGPRWTVRG
ncbi:MAG: cysteine--tRNA ligase, partial [Propionibacteriales bacterium]|nr:cysteine--tRNA ligase [Propionibacteriales bacterium]